MPIPRRLTVSLVASAALLASAAPALSARILPPGTAYGDAAVDLSTNGRAIVAYERLRPGPDLIRVAIRRADRLNRPTVGRDLGRGNLQLARVGGVARRAAPGGLEAPGGAGRLGVEPGAWRTQRLPAGVRSFTRCRRPSPAPAWSSWSATTRTPSPS